MNASQLEIANRLMKEKKHINQELDIWKNELTNREKLGYLQGWNKNYPVGLNTNMSSNTFDMFRIAVMNELRLRLVEIDREFENL